MVYKTTDDGMQSGVEIINDMARVKVGSYKKVLVGGKWMYWRKVTKAEWDSVK